MEENQNNEDVIAVQPQGVPTQLASGIFLMLVISAGGNIYQAMHPRQVATTESAQAAAQTAMAEVGIQSNKRLATMQLEVVKQCVDAHRIPVFLNNNVDCHPDK